VFPPPPPVERRDLLRPPPPLVDLPFVPAAPVPGLLGLPPRLPKERLLLVVVDFVVVVGRG